MTSARLAGLAAIRWVSSHEHEVITGIARHLFLCPTAMVNLDEAEMVDGARASFRGGLSLFSKCAIAHGGVFLVPDAAADERFRDDVMVRAFPHARFYAGTPIIVGGRSVGVLCVIDYVARRAPEPTALDALMSLAALCAQSIERSGQRLTEAVNNAQVALLIERSNAAVLKATEGGLIVYANRAANRLLRAPNDVLIGAPVERYIVGWSGLLAMFEKALASSLDGEDRGRSVLVEALTTDGAVVPARASIGHRSEPNEPQYRIVLDELP